MEAIKTTTGQIPLRQVSRVSVDLLMLDKSNPRLLKGNSRMSDEGIIKSFYDDEDLSELLQSIAANGYLDIEPLVVLEKNNRLVVLEGNRRLAALRLLRNPQVAADIFGQTRAENIVPSMPEEYQSTLHSVSVYRVANREDARSYIGFKHINGPAKWNSYAKAQFAADWHQRGGTSIEEIAQQIGDNHDTVKRMVHAIYVLKQAESAEVYNLSSRKVPRFNFSHLYTALARPPYRKFLGLPESWASYGLTKNPVPKKKLSALREVLIWLYGVKDEEIDPIIKRQNPDIKRLGDVLENQSGLVALRAKRSLADAYASIRPADKAFSTSLYRARDEIREALNWLRGFDGKNEALIDLSKDIWEAAQVLLDRMEKKRKQQATGDSE